MEFGVRVTNMEYAFKPFFSDYTATLRREAALLTSSGKQSRTCMLYAQIDGVEQDGQYPRVRLVMPGFPNLVIKVVYDPNGPHARAKLGVRIMTAIDDLSHHPATQADTGV